MRECRYNLTILVLGPRYPLNMRLGGPLSRSGSYGEEKSLALAGIKQRPSSPSLYRLSYPGCTVIPRVTAVWLTALPAYWDFELPPFPEVSALGSLAAWRDRPIGFQLLVSLSSVCLQTQFALHLIVTDASFTSVMHVFDDCSAVHASISEKENSASTCGHFRVTASVWNLSNFGVCLYFSSATTTTTTNTFLIQFFIFTC
jgi:hypothetical protein